MSVILGLNANHADSAACLLVDGKILAAAEEERFRRIKHWSGFPEQALRYCLGEARLSLNDIDIVAVNTDPRRSMLRKLRYVLQTPSAWTLAGDKLRRRVTGTGVMTRIAATSPNERLRARLEQVEHHHAHLASSWYTSAFDESALLSVDGFGDFSSCVSGYGDATGMHFGARVDFPHSLGVFYQALTQFLGFLRYGDEYKVMGLSSYGMPSFSREMAELISTTADGGYAMNMRYFTHGRHAIEATDDSGVPYFNSLYSDDMTALLGPARAPDSAIDTRHHDIASSLQLRYEQLLHSLLKACHARHPTINLCLSGGCAMNSVANGKIRRTTAFRNIHIQPAAGDAGGALGAALTAYQRVNNRWPRRVKRRLSGRLQVRRPPQYKFNAYLGPAYNDSAIERALGAQSGIVDDDQYGREHFIHTDHLVNWVADRLEQGFIVGWFQGRMEWGPRALGNRSILADPRNPHIQNVLNAKIKRRESFRPFAPSILREHVGDWFEEADDVPHMTQVLPVREDKRALVPAIVHVDGSGRLQTVRREDNLLYHALLNAFYQRTQVPMLLNTSFNENEPVVCTPDQALCCFLRTDMDVLVLGSRVIWRRHAKAMVPEAPNAVNTTLMTAEIRA